MRTPRVSVACLLTFVALGLHCTPVSFAATASKLPLTVRGEEWSMSGDATTVVTAKYDSAYNGTAEIYQAGKRLRRYRFRATLAMGALPLTRNGRKLFLPVRAAGRAGTRVLDLASGHTRAIPGFLTLNVSANGRYLAGDQVDRAGNSRRSGVLDAQTGRFTVFPNTPGYPLIGIKAMSGNGNWVIFFAANARGERCYTWSRVTHVRHTSFCVQQDRSTISDDGRVAVPAMGRFSDATTGRMLSTQFPVGTQWDEYQMLWGFSLTASGDKTLLSCIPVGPPVPPAVSGDDWAKQQRKNGSIFIYDRLAGKFFRPATTLVGLDDANSPGIKNLDLSADGSTIVYLANGALYRLSATAVGPPETLPAACSGS